jgi:hypothetical protein
MSFQCSTYLVATYSPILLIQPTNCFLCAAAVLIHEYCRPGFTVLDYSGGKGGDLQKWSKGRIAYLVLSGTLHL